MNRLIHRWLNSRALTLGSSISLGLISSFLVTFVFPQVFYGPLDYSFQASAFFFGLAGFAPILAITFKDPVGFQLIVKWCFIAAVCGVAVFLLRPGIVTAVICHLGFLVWFAGGAMLAIGSMSV
jgi:hypothetical protein